MNYTVLIVEDDNNIREFLAEALKDSGYRVKSTPDGAKAIKIVRDAKPDLVLLDLGIENVAGETVCEEVKKMHSDLPIIILTAKNTSQDVVRGFNIGADDYISKPFEIDELIARIKTRLKQNGSNILKIEDLSLDTSKLEVKRGSKEIILTAKEFKLLEYLMINEGVVLSRESILDRVWTYSPEIETRVVDVYIGYLRKKIDEGYDKKLIKSARGFGYTIKV